MKITDAIAARLNELLEKYKITKYALSKKMGIPESTLGNIANSINPDLRFSTVILIANGFDMEVSEFLNSPLFSLDNLDI